MPPSTAKNVISVGAIDSNDSSMTDFSSWGPVDDGRLKPDVVATGCQSHGDNGVTSDDLINGYRINCGTSMATAAVSGTVALLLQQYQADYGALPRRQLSRRCSSIRRGISAAVVLTTPLATAWSTRQLRLT